MWKKEISFKRKPKKGKTERLSRRPSRPLRSSHFEERGLSLAEGQGRRHVGDSERPEAVVLDNGDLCSLERTRRPRSSASQRRRFAPSLRARSKRRRRCRSRPSLRKRSSRRCPIRSHPSRSYPLIPCRLNRRPFPLHAVADPLPTRETPPVAALAEPPAPLPGETWRGADQLPPAPEPAAEPVVPAVPVASPVVHPPVPAAELPPRLQPAAKGHRSGRRSSALAQAEDAEADA